MAEREVQLEQISAADFFYRNKALAGFDNPVRATYTIVRELVENALDACELARRPPRITVFMTRSEERVDGRGTIYRLTVSDNGIGLDPSDVPAAFGKVFVSSKYRLMQSRGTFGLGGTMALLYGQITTNMPFKVTTARDGGPVEEFEMKIDIKRNEPIVLKRRRLADACDESFTRVEMHFEGSYGKARRKIVEYLRQTAIVTPYADMLFVDPDGVPYLFVRSTDVIPPLPREAKFHPKGVDLEILMRLISTTKTRTLVTFLTTHFQRVGSKTAREVVRLAGLDPIKRPRNLTDEEIRALFRALRSYPRFLPPDASILSPLSPELLEEGIKKELRPEFVKAVQRPPSVFEAHPFIVETALAYGGELRPTGEIQLYRFANRIPLLYDVSSDVSYAVARRIDWGNYGLRSLEEEPVALFVHIVSTKIPFKTVGKEFIANKPEIAREIELGLRICARELKSFLHRKRRAEMARARYEAFARYYELISEVVEDLTGERPPVEKILSKVRPPAGVKKNGS